MSGREYSPSPSPGEDGGDDEQEWEVVGIVGESVDTFGQKRYEVKWGGWKRKDGTDTTWEKADPNSDLIKQLNKLGLIEKWEREQKAKRIAQANKSPAIQIGYADGQMWHEDRTIELARGYEELKARWLPDGMDPRQPIDFDATCKRLRPSAPPTNAGPGAGAASSAHAPSSASSKPSSRGSSSSSPASQQSGHQQRPTKPLPRRVAKPPSLEEKWAQELRGAAPVVFVNEVNYEDVPQLVDGFQYLERSYVRATGVESNANIADLLVSCDCEGRCTDASECDCQGPSELVNKDGAKVFAYTRKRLFNFQLPQGMEVLECNQSCQCDDSCSNRVAQRPRDVPIEVFRTKSCGWGARATVSVPRGKVLGIYTGLLIRREDADKFEGERKSYIFDLDVHEGPTDEDDGTEKYSVDGYAHGNWTRFVNHSCEPNLRVVPVIWDTIPELNQPYLAFVAAKDIDARTELTIDYDPKAAAETRKKNKGREKTPEGARPCVCNADNCRGWVRV